MQCSRGLDDIHGVRLETLTVNGVKKVIDGIAGDTARSGESHREVFAVEGGELFTFNGELHRF